MDASSFGIFISVIYTTSRRGSAHHETSRTLTVLILAVSLIYPDGSKAMTPNTENYPSSHRRHYHLLFISAQLATAMYRLTKYTYLDAVSVHGSLALPPGAGGPSPGFYRYN